MKIEILNLYTNAVIFSHDAEPNSIAITVRDALASGVNLSYANLRGTNLRDADLRGANLRDADMRYAILRGADLRDADMSGANLRYAILSGADLSGTNLHGTNLHGTNLSGAILSSANMSGANMSGAILSSANLTPVRDDIWAVLSSAPSEVPALIAALKAGRVDGSTYSGECSCLVGTLATARNVSVRDLLGLSPNESRPAERFFLAIKEGDTPETSQFSALAMQWSQQWLNTMTAAFSTIQVEK
jgi:hypothetical protein